MRIKVKKVIIFLIVPATLIIGLFIAFMFSSGKYLIYDNNGYYQAKRLIAVGQHLFVLRDEKTYEDKKTALELSDYNTEFFVGKIKKINYIQVINDSEPDLLSAKTWDIKYLGKYRIEVSGNTGLLYLNQKNGRLYGSMQFPQWAKGAVEPLKSLEISGGRISFIRSVETAKEAEQLGVRVYFTQKYYGIYKRDGHEIQGDYINRGAQSNWRAYRIK